MIKNIFSWNKKGLSTIIGYVILISIAITMSYLVYSWMKTYVPKDALECPDGTSAFIKSYNYDCTNNILNITLKNTGRFSLDGYYIHASNKTEEEIPTIDISTKIKDGGEISGTGITFSEITENSLSPPEEPNSILSSFDVSGYGRLYKVEIIPIRIQEYNSKKRIVSCTEAVVSEKILCS